MADFQDLNLIDTPPSFNLGLATVNRINNAFVEYAKQYVAQEWNSAFIQLDIVSQEIDPFLKDDEREESMEHYGNIIKEINHIDTTMKQAPNSKSVSVQSDLPKYVREWSFWLRRKAHKHKLYMPLTSDPRFSTMRA